MKSGPLRHFIFIAVPALVLTVAGIFLVALLAGRLQVARDAARAEARRVRAKVVRSILREGAASKEDLAALLRGLTERELPAAGCFLWKKDVGVVVSTGMPSSVLAALTPESRWTLEGRSGATAPYNWEPFGDEGRMVFWCRLPEGGVAGVLADPPSEPVVYDLRLVWGIGGCLSLFLPLTLLAAAASLVRDARRAERESRQKTSFVSHVSHELKTPLAGIVPLAQMLKKGKITDRDDLQEAYDVIADESRRLAAMVEDLLALTRLELKRRTYAPSSFDAVDLAREAAGVARARFAEGLLTVVEGPPARVRADRGAAKGILMNLLDNAAKYAPGTPVEIACTARGNGRVGIEVRDRGPGLSAEQRERAFESFWRADDRTVAETGGFGLGLAISRGDARGMGGDLTVAARAGGGAVFTLELPEDDHG